VPDTLDVCPTVFNPDQELAESGRGLACDCPCFDAADLDRLVLFIDADCTNGAILTELVAGDGSVYRAGTNLDVVGGCYFRDLRSPLPPVDRQFPYVGDPLADQYHEGCQELLISSQMWRLNCGGG